MDGARLDQQENCIAWTDLLSELTWEMRFQTLCEELEIFNPIAAWSQIETWMQDGILLADIDPDYKNTAALKSFLKRVLVAATQAQQEPKGTKEDPLYHKLERSDIFKKIYGINPQAAKSILIFACSRKSGSEAARLETEVGRWSAFQFNQPPDTYFYRQGNDLFGTEQRRDNGILMRETGKKPQISQYQTIQNNSLRCLGKYLINRRNFDAVDANRQFQKCLSNQNAPEGHLGLLAFANLAGQLQTYCPDVYSSAQTIIDQAVNSHDAAEMQLYFLGSIMRRTRQSIGVAQNVDSLSIETNRDFQVRVQTMLEQDAPGWEAALQTIAQNIGIQPQSFGRLI